MPELKIKNIKIGCHSYAVNAVNPEEMGDNGTIGRIALFDGQILIDNTHCRRSQGEVLVHEILHGLFFDAGFPIGRNKEEKLIRSLSPRLSAFLADNPTEVRELLKMLKP